MEGDFKSAQRFSAANARRAEKPTFQVLRQHLIH